MKTLSGVEVFAVGKWNGQEFTSSDLDGMVRAFNQLKLSGRLPVKLGHNTDDSEPAVGWITSLAREGDRLVASLSHVPDELVDSIRDGRFRHVSIELLKNVTFNGNTYPWVPDGLAILGAARPAVDVLAGLHQAMMASTLSGIAFGARIAFSRDDAGGSGGSGADAAAQLERDRQQLAREREQFRAERALMRRERVTFQLESLVERGQLLPRSVAMARKQLRLDDDEAILALQDAELAEFVSDRQDADRDQLTRNRSHQGGGRVELSSDGPDSPVRESPDAELLRRAQELVDQRAREGRPFKEGPGQLPPIAQAGQIIMRRDKDLSARYFSYPDTRWGGR